MYHSQHHKALRYQMVQIVYNFKNELPTINRIVKNNRIILSKVVTTYAAYLWRKITKEDKLKYELIADS
jgi:hypothetical protein